MECVNTCVAGRTPQNIDNFIKNDVLKTKKKGMNKIKLHKEVVNTKRNTRKTLLKEEKNIMSKINSKLTKKKLLQKKL